MDLTKNIEYCYTLCEKGKAMGEKFLKENNSAFDAALDFQLFVKDCTQTCTKCSDDFSCGGVSK